MPPTDRRPPWTVLLIGGSSGVGKTVVAQRIARRIGVSAVQVDDIRLALQRLTTPAEQPDLHFFLATPDVWRLPPERLAERLTAVARVVSHTIEIVVAHHVATGLPIILEGDGILPSMAARRRFADLEAGDHVRSVFLFEEDESALVANMRGRGRGYDDKLGPEQQTQAQMNFLYGRWLRLEANRLRLPTLPARPWETLADRILAAVEEA